MVNERKRLAGRRQNRTITTLATLTYRLEFVTHPPRWKERTMVHLRGHPASRAIWSLLAGLALVLAPVTADGAPGGGVCVGTMHLKACVPPDSQTG
jgi:hypothetical protein